MKQKNSLRWKAALSLLLVMTLLGGLAAGAFSEEAALNDGSPWVDYVLRENIATVTERPESPRDDLYLYVNYDWARTAEIRPGQRSESAFTAVALEIRDQCLALLKDDSLSGEDTALVQGLFRAWLDWDARNALGVKPLQALVDRIRAVPDLDGLGLLLCDPEAEADSLFDWGVNTGLNDPETYLLLLSPMSLLLRDSAEYANRTELGVRLEAANRTATTAMLTRLGYSAEEADEVVDRALALETDLAPKIMTSKERLSPDYIQRINNQMSMSEALGLCERFPLGGILDSFGYGGAEQCLVTEPAFFGKLDEVYTPERLEDLKSFLIVRVVLSNMMFLDRESYETYIAFNNAVNGSTGARPDEEVALEIVRGMLTTPMDRAFLARYDASVMKEDITRICRECIDYYRDMLSTEVWLSEETRAKAIEKLDAMTINAVYPEKWRDYSGLSLDGLGYYDCKNAIVLFNRTYNTSLLGTKIDHDLWNFDILETNAYYSPSGNSINIIRGILGGSFYGEDMTREELYAGIGTVIGHEISHAFDTNGAQFDASGSLKNWWTEADFTAFMARAQKLVDYYSGMTAFGGYPVQGANIQTEAIADMAGVKCVLGILAQGGEAVDYRAFFEAYAKLWARLNTREMEYYCLTQDSHPLHYLRVNVTVQQFDQFLEAFGITEGDGMYLAPADRVLVW